MFSAMMLSKICRFLSLACAAAAFAAAPKLSGAVSIPVPNGSFEEPLVNTNLAPVDLRINSWQKAPKPDWYDEAANGPWDQLAGVFPNTAPGSADHIDNLDGIQAIYLFSVPQMSVFQDDKSVDWRGPASSGAFNAKFETGKSYTLTVGIVGGGGAMPAGATLMASLYYLDAQSNRVTVASVPIVYDTNTFPNRTRAVDFSAATSFVKTADAWSGKNIGIAFDTAVGPQNAGGYWDLENVRLTSENAPGTIPIPNGSFEEPLVNTNLAPVDLRINSWQKAPKPDWYDEAANGPWDQLAGVFPNTAPGSADYIDNLDGIQAIYLFSVPQMGLYQDNKTADWRGPSSAGAFDAKYEVGKSYTLTVGVVAGGGGMPEGAMMTARLYYLDEASNRVTVASVLIAYQPNTFPNRTHAVDFQAKTSMAWPTHAWAGKNIGIAFETAVGPQNAGGYWDLENVRLTFEPEYVFGLGHQYAKDQKELRLTWPTRSGWSYQVSRSTAGLNAWANVGAPLPGTGGEVTQTVSISEFPHAFYRVTASQPAP